MAGPTVRFLGWQRDRSDRRLLSKLPRVAFPGRRRLRDRADRGPRLRCTGDRAGTRRRGRDRRRHRGPNLCRADFAACSPRSTPGRATVARTIRSRAAAERRHFAVPSFATAFSNSSPKVDERATPTTSCRRRLAFANRSAPLNVHADSARDLSAVVNRHHRSTAWRVKSRPWPSLSWRPGPSCVRPWLLWLRHAGRAREPLFKRTALPESWRR